MIVGLYATCMASFNLLWVTYGINLSRKIRLVVRCKFKLPIASEQRLVGETEWQMVRHYRVSLKLVFSGFRLSRLGSRLANCWPSNLGLRSDINHTWVLSGRKGCNPVLNRTGQTQSDWLEKHPLCMWREGTGSLLSSYSIQFDEQTSICNFLRPKERRGEERKK